MKRPQTTQVLAYRAPVHLAELPIEGAIPSPMCHFPMGNAHNDFILLSRIEFMQCLGKVDHSQLTLQTSYQNINSYVYG